MQFSQTRSQRQTPMADTIDFTPILAQLSADVLIEELRRRLNLAAASGETPVAASAPTLPAPARDVGPSGPIRSDEFFRLSTPEAVKKFLGMAKRPQPAKVIVASLEAGGVLTTAKNFY